MNIHKSVLLKESIKGLNLKEGSVVVDATLGSGGHAKSILEKIGKTGKLIALDLDEKNLKDFGEEEKNVILVQENFANIKEILTNLKIEKADAILADLGYSSDQLESPEYGMSFRLDAPLDMRLSRKGNLDARKIVNEYSEEELARIIRDFGEERYAKRIAKRIILRRKEKPIETTLELAQVIHSAVPERYRSSRLHPATRTFQAIRIEVNSELQNLEKFIEKSIEVLNNRGRLAIIAFHSLEDRIVKRSFRENARGCICPKEFPTCVCRNKEKIKIITRHPIVPLPEELSENPRSRSAKLRIAEKI